LRCAPASSTAKLIACDANGLADFQLLRWRKRDDPAIFWGSHRRGVQQVIYRVAEIIEGGRGRRRPVAGVDDIGPVYAVTPRPGERRGAGRAAGASGVGRAAAVAPDRVKVNELGERVRGGSQASVGVSDFVDLSVAAIDRGHQQRRRKVERALPEPRILDDRL